ncbi:PEP/pyruvate-binding domain-containing protein [Anaerocolumna sp.]|uniref:PEP/pyruvate-binding domain-containing protein n=1 Tax=Anaerocolumna sp. TaxID=2041569 RepID=UPI0028ACFFEF|nr:PEP/pyruvate-binding domain-containing protein [Anaerocolumna sp.]
MIKKLININEHDKVYVGIKAYNCSIMLKKKINVVDGFVLYGNLNKDDFTVAETLMKDDALYVVRSSMSDEDGENISLAGRYLTIFSVDKKTLRQAVSDVYEQAGNCEKKAVLVQELIESEVSGVIFTKNPISGKGVLINAAFGIGENIVSGSETPDEFEIIDEMIKHSINTKSSVFTYGKEMEIGKDFLLNKSTARTVIHNDGKLLLSISFLDKNKPVLYSEQIKTLAHEAKKIKEIFGCEQDIEFAYANQSFYFLQSRPITIVTSDYKKNIVKQSNIDKHEKQVFIGQKVSYGNYIGRVVKLNVKDKVKKLNNLVLVVDEFYPELIYKLDDIGAIITAKGGKLSHAAIVAREKGIPCVIGLKEEINKLENGDLVFVDADYGEVILYEKS